MKNIEYYIIPELVSAATAGSPVGIGGWQPNGLSGRGRSRWVRAAGVKAGRRMCTSVYWRPNFGGQSTQIQLCNFWLFWWWCILWGGTSCKKYTPRTFIHQDIPVHVRLLAWWWCIFTVPGEEFPVPARPHPITQGYHIIPFGSSPSLRSCWPG